MRLLHFIRNDRSEDCKKLLDGLESKSKRKILMMVDPTGQTVAHHAAKLELHRILSLFINEIPPLDVDGIFSIEPVVDCTANLFVNAIDSKGRTPLHLAAQAGCIRCGMVTVLEYSILENNAKKAQNNIVTISISREKKQVYRENS